ncbi:hypothetical protein FB451DRAFT_1300949 [Mycena latifolia]|nr:hypothetical protein FB451DRAFT_1321120 [Mycena latifolia]KAJ7440192.1 hypothetical protein FB451DRAFT_1300949 [Mycena latifolia]
MSSANWMNLTVVTQPDMRGFLKNPAFQNAISSVARRALDKVMNQMKELTALPVEEAVAMVSAKSEEYVQSEVETFIEMATKSPAYAGLDQMSWMNLTIVTQPDMRGFLKNPAFQNAISSVAQRTIDAAMKQMKELTALPVEEAVAMVSAKSEEYVQREMETFIKMATKSAAYTGLGSLKMMTPEQIRAYNAFAPQISADLVPEEDETSFH